MLPEFVFALQLVFYIIFFLKNNQIDASLSVFELFAVLISKVKDLNNIIFMYF